MEYPEARQSKIYIPEINKHQARELIQWNKLQLGRYIRAVTGHNNLLYHLHNIDNDISEICRFCLESREEFHHLASDCPPLWWERHQITASRGEQTAQWTPEQILAFTMIPKINEAFAKPLYVLSGNYDHHELGFRTRNHQYQEVRNSDISDTSEDSNMSTSSDEDTEHDASDMSISSSDPDEPIIVD